MQIGRKVYYELATGNVIVDTGERQGDVVATTEEQDFQMYSDLQPYQQNTVGVLQLEYGQDDQNFGVYPYHVDITQTPPVVVWDTTATDLTNAQSQKIAQLRDMYSQTLAAGFHTTIGSTEYTFGWQTSDEANMNALQTAVTQGFLTFPVQYADVHGSPLSIPDQTTLNTIESTAAKFMSAQHQQVQNLIGQVQTAATVSAVNGIQWAPASY